MMKFLYQGNRWPNKQQKSEILFWTVLIFFEVVVAGAIQHKYQGVWYYILFYALNIGLFYSHASLVMKSFRSQTVGGVTKLVLLVLAELCAYIFLSVLISLVLEKQTHPDPEKALKFNFRYFAVTLYRASIFLIYGTGYFFLRESVRRTKAEAAKTLENEHLKLRLLQAEKDYLRAQISPHLLFNTLGFIQIAAQQDPEKADEAVERLTNIMDYAMAKNKQEYAELNSEVEQIENMIALNQLRYGGKLNLKFIKQGSGEQVFIIPIILLTLVENVFTHGNLLSPECAATIELKYSANELLFRTCNLSADTLKTKAEATGIKNIASRLAQSYPKQYDFEYGLIHGLYITELRIDFGQNS